MRHVTSILLSLILAPAIWALTGYGLDASGRVGSRPDGTFAIGPLVGLGALLAAAILYAALLLPRLSPVGPALTGLAYLAMAGWVAGYPALARRTLAVLPFGLGGAVIRPAQGVAVLLGLPLLATALSTRRWRRFDNVPALYAPPDEPERELPISPAAPVDPGWPVSPYAPVHTAEAGWPPPGWAPPGIGGPPEATWRPPGGGPPPGLSWPPFGTPADHWPDPARDADTADLTQALMPLRRAAPPPGVSP